MNFYLSNFSSLLITHPKQISRKITKRQNTRIRPPLSAVQTRQEIGKHGQTQVHRRFEKRANWKFL